MIHKSQFKEVTVTSDALVCNHCKKHLPRGEKVLMNFNRDRDGIYGGVTTLEFCGAECLAEYRHKRASVKDRMLNRLNVQFN